MNILNTEPYTSKRLRRQMLCYMYFTTIKNKCTKINQEPSRTVLGEMRKEGFRRKYTQMLRFIAPGGEIFFLKCSGLFKVYTHLMFMHNQNLAQIIRKTKTISQIRKK